MKLHEIDALLADTSSRIGYEPPPVTPEAIAQPVAFRDEAAQNNRRNRQEAESYMGDVQDYLGKVRRGRSLRAVNPNQPAFSSRAEMLRQAQKIEKANRAERAR